MLYFLLVASVWVANVLCNPCGSGWALYEPDDTCLRYFNLDKNFQDSVDYCAGFGGSLARINSQEKNDFLTQIFNNAAEQFWIPMTDLDSQGVFVYLDGSSLGTYQGGWMESVHYSDNEAHSCLSRKPVFSNGVYTHFWANVLCTNSRTFVCEKDKPDPTCSPGWYLSDAESCIKVVKGVKRNFSGARVYCQNLHGDLAMSVTSSGQRSRLMSQTRFKGHFWIGVHAPDNDGTFKYVDSSLVTGTPPFKSGRPAANSVNYCVSMKKGSWFDKKCWRWMFFACEKEPIYT